MRKPRKELRGKERIEAMELIRKRLEAPTLAEVAAKFGVSVQTVTRLQDAVIAKWNRAK